MKMKKIFIAAAGIFMMASSFAQTKVKKPREGLMYCA